MAIAERELSPLAIPLALTEEEYLARGEFDEEKSEYIKYIKGKIQALSGGTDYHGGIAMKSPSQQAARYQKDSVGKPPLGSGR